MLCWLEIGREGCLHMNLAIKSWGVRLSSQITHEPSTDTANERRESDCGRIVEAQELASPNGFGGILSVKGRECRGST